MVPLFTIIITMIIILGLASVGGSLSERGGVINLSIEGFMTIGAISYAMFAGKISGGSAQNASATQIGYMLIAGLMTMLFAIIYGILVIYLKANQTIAGIALNALALAVSLFIVNSKLFNPSAPRRTDMIVLQKTLFSLAGSGNADNPLSIVNSTVLLGIPIIILVIVFLNKTSLGVKIKTCGEQPQAAASLGIKVRSTQLLAVALAAATSGIAGSMFAQMNQFFNGSTRGYGFLAVAIVIFGQWRPSIIILGAVIFGGLTGLVYNPQLTPGLSDYNSDLLSILPYGVSLFVLIFTQKFSKVPKALGVPYVNQGR